MAYGFESKNDNGFIQISDSVANYYMLYSGTIIVPPKSPLSTSINRGTVVTVSHPIAFDAICVATEDGLVIPKAVFSQSTTSTTITSNELSTQTTVKYWLFKKYTSLSPSTSGYGIEIYNSTGGVAFSSNYPKLMRSFSTIPITTLSTTQNYSLPTDRRFAFLLYGSVYNTAVAPTKAAPDVKIFPVIRTYSGGVSAQFSSIRGERLSSSGPVYNGGLIAIDVTNY
jgi:hypothetical protein